MDEAKMRELLNSSGIPFAYHIWKNPPALPWGVYRFSNTSEMYADGVLYFAVKQYQIELYTDRKQPQTEQKLEDVLTHANIAFSKSETYIESEQMYQILYECEV